MSPKGSGGIWERLHHDWSDPNRVVMTTTDSDVRGGPRATPTRLRPQPDGTTDVDALVVREGKDVKGRVLAVVLGTVGKRALAKELGQTVKAIEARQRAA